MKAPRADPLTAFEKSELQASIRDVIDDAQVRVAVTYKRFGSSSLSIETGAVTPTETSYSVNAIRGQVSVQEVDNSGGRLQIGDRKYLIDKADIALAPKTEDVIVEGSDVFEVVMWKEDMLGFVYEFAVRKV